MTRRILTAMFAFAVLALSLPAQADETKVPATSDEGWIDLFNGKDLTGLKLHESATNNPKTKWEVVDGLLTGTGVASHIFSEKGDYTDFHYRVVAKISDKGNSGQYFRTKFEGGFPTGYEAQINATGGDVIKTGSLYPGGPLSKYRKEIAIVLNKAPHAFDEFFTQEVIADGAHIIIKVNDKVTLDWTDPDNTFKSGHFAIQQHDPGSKVQVKKIQWKPLKK